MRQDDALAVAWWEHARWGMTSPPSLTSGWATRTATAASEEKEEEDEEQEEDDEEKEEEEEEEEEQNARWGVTSPPSLTSAWATRTATAAEYPSLPTELPIWLGGVRR